MGHKGCISRLSIRRLGFAFGLIWGLGMLLMGWAGWLSGFGVPMTRMWGTVYIGFAPTFVGGILGFIWGFIDFFIFGALVAWVYNCACCKKKEAEAQQG